MRSSVVKRGVVRLLGGLSGVYPALKAARIEPVAAFRS